MLLQVIENREIAEYQMEASARPRQGLGQILLEEREVRSFQTGCWRGETLGKSACDSKLPAGDIAADGLDLKSQVQSLGSDAPGPGAGAAAGVEDAQ